MLVLKMSSLFRRDTAKQSRLPEPGSEEAMAQWCVALKEVDRAMREAREAYPELDRGPLGWWTKADLTKALDAREITPSEYARLHTLAAQRELRTEAALVATNLGALHVLVHAEDYSGPPEGDQDEPEAEAVDWRCEGSLSMGAVIPFRPRA